MADLFRERKRWQLQDGPHGTLRRLRSQLAEDGCVESQLIIAQKLLDEGKGDRKKEEEAVSWLVKAAKEDSGSARQLLKNCFKQETGVTSENYNDVVKCLATDDIEHALRSAARKLYSKLSVDGLVTSKMLMDCLRNQNQEIDDERSVCCDQPCDNVSLVCTGGIVYKEEDLLDIASKIATGKELDHAVDWEEQAERIKGLTWREKLCNPWRCYTTCFAETLDQLVASGNGVLATIIYPSNVHFILILALQWFLYKEEITSSLVPILLFYFTYTSLAISTLEMINLHKWLTSLKNWLLILAFPSIYHDQLESLFLWNRFTNSYFRFFMSLSVFLFVYPLVPREWIMFGECTVLSAFYFLLTFISIGQKSDWLVTLSVTMHILLTAIPWAVLNIPSWDFIGDWILSFGSFQVGPFLRLHLGLPASLFAFIPLVFITLIFRKHSYGIHHVLLPHLVCVFWLQLAIMFLLEVSPASLFRGLVLVPTSLALFPFYYYFILACVTLPVLFSFVFHMDFFPFCCIIHISAISQMCSQNQRLITFIRRFFVIALIVSLIPPLFTHYSSYNWLSTYRPSPPANLSWADYYHSCHHPAWSTQSSVAKVQYECGMLSGMPVHWEGSVVRIDIKKTRNLLERNLNYLPNSIANWFRCMFGHRCPVDQQEHNVTDHLCKLRPGECHVANWNIHSYEVVLGVKHHSDTSHVFAEAGMEFSELLLQVHRTDVIAFHGSLVGDVGGPKPVVKLSLVQCVACTHPLKSVSAVEPFDLSKSFRSLFHFFLAPLFEFRDSV